MVSEVPAIPGTRPERPARAAVQRRILTFLFLTSVVTYLDRVNISVASAAIEREFHLDKIQLGSVFSAFVVGYMVSQIPGGWAGDRFGHRITLTFALLWWSVFTALTAFGGSAFLGGLLGVLPSFWLMRFLVGVGEAAAYPCANGIIGRWFGMEERGLAAGMMFAGIGVGSAVAPPFVAWIMVNFGWRSAFIASAAVGIALATFLYRAIPPEDKAAGPKPQKLTMREIASSRQLWLLMISIFFFGYITYVYYFWFYPYLVDVRGISLLRSSFFTAMPFLAMAVTAPLGGWLSDRLTASMGKVRARRRVAGGGLVAAALLIPTGATIPNQYLAVACLALGAGSVYLAISAYFATALDVFQDHPATASGAMNTGASFGGVIAPLLTPWMARRFGWVAALSLAGAFALTAAILWQFTGVRDEKRDG